MCDDQGGASVIKRATAALISRSFSLSRLLVASSSTRMGAFFRKARAKARRCRCPPESLAPRSPTTVS